QERSSRGWVPSPCWLSSTWHDTVILSADAEGPDVTKYPTCRWIADQHFRIMLSRVEDVEIVERCIATGAGDELFGQGALTGLTCTGDHDCPHDAQLSTYSVAKLHPSSPPDPAFQGGWSPVVSWNRDRHESR